MDSRPLNLREVAENTMHEVNGAVKDFCSLFSYLKLDIIPIETPIKGVGESKALSIAIFNDKVIATRKRIASHLQQRGYSPQSPHWAKMIHLTAALCGIGSSHELCALQTLKLLRAGCPWVCQVLFSSAGEHMSLMIGNTPVKFEVLQTHPEDHLLIDPSLRHIVKANTALADSILRNYIGIKNINYYTFTVFTNKNLPMAEELFEVAKSISAQIKAERAARRIPETKTCLSMATSLFKNPGAQIQAELQRITHREWKYHPPRNSMDLPMVTCCSMEKSPISNIEKYFQQQDKMPCLRKEILADKKPWVYIGRLINPNLENLKKINPMPLISPRQLRPSGARAK